MRKIWFYVMMICCALVAFSSCNKDEEEPIDEEWKLANEIAFSEIAKKAEKGEDGYKKLQSLGNNGFVCYKVLKEGDGTEQIYYNSVVKLYYTAKRFVSTEQMELYVFEKNDLPYDAPVNMSANLLIDGFSLALQYMKPGDRWEVWIPQKLGYGNLNDPNYPPPYSTLMYEIEVVEIVTP